MQIGDLVKHKGGSGWETMQGKVGVVVEKLNPTIIDHPSYHRYHVTWCSEDIPRFFRDFRYWHDHLEVINAKR